MLPDCFLFTMGAKLKVFIQLILISGYQRNKGKNSENCE